MVPGWVPALPQWQGKAKDQETQLQIAETWYSAWWTGRACSQTTRVCIPAQILPDQVTLSNFLYCSGAQFPYLKKRIIKPPQGIVANIN